MVLKYVLQFSSLHADFVVNRFFTKMFRTTSIEIVRNCQGKL